MPPPEDPFVENSGSSDSTNERGKDGVVAFDGSRKKGDLVWSGTKELSKALSPAEQKALTAKNQLVMKDHPLKKLASTELYKLGEKPKVMTTVQKDFGRGPAQHQVEISSSRKGGEKVDRLPQVNDGLKAAGFKPDGEPLIPGGKKHSHSAKCGEIECANRLVKANKNDPDVLRGAIYHSTSLVNGQPQTVRPCEGCQAFIDATGGHALRKRGPPGCKCPPGQTKAKPTKPSTTKSSSKPSNDASKKPVAEEQGPPHKPEKQVTPSSPKPEKLAKQQGHPLDPKKQVPALSSQPEKVTKQQSPPTKPKNEMTPPSPKPEKSTKQ